MASTGGVSGEPAIWLLLYEKLLTQRSKANTMFALKNLCVDMSWGDLKDGMADNWCWLVGRTFAGAMVRQLHIFYPVASWLLTTWRQGPKGKHQVRKTREHGNRNKKRESRSRIIQFYKSCSIYLFYNTMVIWRVTKPSPHSTEGNYFTLTGRQMYVQFLNSHSFYDLCLS